MDKTFSQQSKKEQLESIIRETLTPLIDNDYVLYGLPYHSNIGDTLIWEGELEFLKTVKHKCRGVCGWNTYPDKPLKDKNTIILIHGGGYLGDIWRNGWEKVLDCIKKNFDHKIILLPNTIHYTNESLIQEDERILSNCKELIICARDRKSYCLAKEIFVNNTTLLVPDMAFCINSDYLKKWYKPVLKNALLLKRQDRELSTTPIPRSIFLENPEIQDWPSMCKVSQKEKWFLRIDKRIDRLIPSLPMFASIKDWMYRAIYRKLMTHIGTEFISSYRKIYTTRLHVMILSVLIGKEVYLIDNSYGKLSSFYDTWLTDCQNTYIYNE